MNYKFQEGDRVRILTRVQMYNMAQVSVPVRQADGGSHMVCQSGRQEYVPNMIPSKGKCRTVTRVRRVGYSLDGVDYRFPEWILRRVD